MAGPLLVGDNYFTKAVQELIDHTLETNLRNNLIALAPGNYRPATLVKGSNSIMRFLAVADQAVVAGTPSAGTPPWLTEATAPTADKLVVGYEELTAYQAGYTWTLSDLALAEFPIDLLQVNIERAVRHAAAVADLFAIQTYVAGTSIQYVAASEGATLITNIVTAGQVKKAVATLKADNVPTFPDGSFHGMVHPDVVYDLQVESNVGGWIDANRYAEASGNRALFTGELGMLAGVRFMETAALPFKNDGSSSVDVYPTIIYGPDALAFGDWGATEVIVTPPGGVSDPLRQKATVGWKARFGAILMGVGSLIEATAGPRYVTIRSAATIG